MDHQPSPSGLSAESQDYRTALFASLVLQQTNMGLTLLGKSPHPDTGQKSVDLDSSKLIIDQLEMLTVKTKGNLDKREEQLLKDSLTGLRMAFVEAANSPASAPRH
jgi:hypothetical protein